MAKAHKTFHINVPEEDLELMEWLSVQYNQSSSVRELIRAAYREYGPVDLFTGKCAERTPGVRGRAKQAREVESTEQSRRIAQAAAKAATGGEPGAGHKADVPDAPVGERAEARADAEGDSARRSEAAEPVEKPRTSAPAEREKGKARAPSRDKPPDRKRGGIRMDASVLLGASGRQAKSKPSRKQESKKGYDTKDDKKKDAIKDLMNLMDL